MKPIIKIDVATPICKECHAHMVRDYEKMVYVCPLCRRETQEGEK